MDRPRRVPQAARARCAQGEAVRVRNIESKREFMAKVTAENRAEVRF